MSSFVVIEGIDGSGKSSITEWLKDQFENVHITREPTDSEVGEMAKRAANKEHSPYLDLFLYLADRVEHTEDIQERVKDGQLVICDRYWGSTSAYQAASDDMSLEYTEEIQEPFIKEPDLTILLDVKPEIGIDRISTRDEKSKYERVKFLNKVRANYLELAERHDWKIIDAEKSLEEVKQEVYSAIKKETIK